MAKLILESEVEGLGEVLRTDASFDEAIVLLKLERIKYPISARDLAYARMQKGKRSSLSTNGSYARGSGTDITCKSKLNYAKPF